MDPQRHAERIDSGVQFGRQAAARTSDGGSFTPLAPVASARTFEIVLLIRVFEVRRIGRGKEKPLPYTGVRPASETRMDCGPFAEYLQEITPMRRVARYPQDRIDDQPVIHPVPSRCATPPGR